MELLERLRNETRDAHIALETISGAGRILDHSVTLEQYIHLLKANYSAYAKAESQLSNLENENISSWIEKDLIGMESSIPEVDQNKKSTDALRQLGIRYVIEGSLLGGAMIAQHIKQCEDLSSIPEQQFYAAGTPARAGRWRSFIKEVKSTTYSPADEEEIILAANETFDMFQQEFKQFDK